MKLTNRHLEMITALEKDVKSVEVRLIAMDYKEEGIEGGWACFQIWMTLDNGKKGKKELREIESDTYTETQEIVTEWETMLKCSILKDLDWVTITVERD